VQFLSTPYYIPQSGKGKKKGGPWKGKGGQRQQSTNNRRKPGKGKQQRQKNQAPTTDWNTFDGIKDGIKRLIERIKNDVNPELFFCGQV